MGGDCRPGRREDKTFQQLTDEAYSDLLKKHKQPVGLMASLKESVRSARVRRGNADEVCTGCLSVGGWSLSGFFSHTVDRRLLSHVCIGHEGVVPNARRQRMIILDGEDSLPAQVTRRCRARDSGTHY